MKRSSLDHLRCPNCHFVLELEILSESDEVAEGFLSCSRCYRKYPIILGIPILWPELESYLSNRAQLGGYLMLQAKHDGTKSFVKNSLRQIKQKNSDITQIESNWVKTYKNSLRSRFYQQIKRTLQKIPKFEMVLEHGCSIGYITNFLAKKHEIVFGIDQSFPAILEARKNQARNVDFFVADSLKSPFEQKKFGLVVGLNLLELTEPTDFLDVISSQVHGMIVISDPYDYERGHNSVKNKLDPIALRTELEKRGFTLVYNTKKPSFVPWRLNINSRLSLHYKVDLVVGFRQVCG